VSAPARPPVGRAGSRAPTKPVTRLPCIVAYALTRKAGREVVSILRVIHTAGDWPDEEWFR
jgi:toxin ParE1/3/4